MPSDSEEKNSLGLSRALGLKEVVAVEVGQTIGAGVFALTAIAAGICGPALPLAFVIAAAPVAFLLATLAGLSSAIPTVGGSYRYPSRLFSPLWAFLGVWGFALGMVFGLFPLLAVTCTHYLQSLWPALPETTTSVAIITIFFLANLFGIGIAAAVQTGMVVVLLLALLSYCLGGLPHVQPALLHPFMVKGAGGLLAAAALLTFAQMGSNVVIELGGEIKNPGRNMPVSFLISMPIVVVIYIFVGIVTIGVTPWVGVEKGKDLTEAARMFMGGPWLVFFVIGGAVLAITTTINSSFMCVTKSMMILAADGLIPRILAKTHPRFKTPWYFLTLIWGLSVISIVTRMPVEVFGAYAAIGSLILYVPVMISAMMLKKKRPLEYENAPFKLRGALYWLAPSAGLALSIMTIGILLFDSLRRGATEIIFFVIWFLIGAPAFLLLKKRLERNSGKSLDEIISADTFQ